MELRDYLNVIYMRRRMIILSALALMLAATAVSLVQSPSYMSEAKILVSEKDTGAALFGIVLPELSSQPERGILTQVQLMQLRPLAERAIRTLGLESTPEALLAHVEVAAVGQTNVVTIRATAGTAQQAADIANAMAGQYVSWARDIQRESVTAAATEVELRLQESKSEILELGRRIGDEGMSDNLAAELQIATGSYTTLAEKLEELRINEQLEVGPGRVVSSAVEIDQPVAPRPLRNGAAGLIIGLILGLGMAFLYEYLDNTIKSTEQAEKMYGAPVLGIVPMEKLLKTDGRSVSVVDSPGSPAAEAYRVVRNSLDFVNFEHNIKSLLVTSAAPAEGKSTVSANLAVALAQTGKRVVLISCDFRRPTTEHFFNVNNLVGLSDVLLGSHSLKAALQRPLDDSLLVLTSGKMPPNPSELLGSTKMQMVIEELKEWADWVLVDTPPVLAVADPVSISRWVDGVLMVSKAGSSTREAAEKSVELLSKVGAKMHGVVVWGLEMTGGNPAYGYGYYTGGYYYHKSYYGYGSDSLASGGRQGVQVPRLSLRQQVAVAARRVFIAVLSFLMLVGLTAVVAYALDAYFEWGVLAGLLG